MVGYQDPNLLARFLREQGGTIPQSDHDRISQTIREQTELRNPANPNNLLGGARPSPTPQVTVPDIDDAPLAAVGANAPKPGDRVERGEGGAITVFHADGSRTVTYPGGLKVKIEADGTTTTVLAGGGPSTGHAVNGGVPGDMLANPPDLLKEFLESDPALVLNAVQNKFRTDGASQVFLNWFGRNFDRFYGEYLGIIAQEALNGGVPKTQFTEWVLSNAVTRSYFGDTAWQRGDNSTRFASFASQSGGQ